MNRYIKFVGESVLNTLCKLHNFQEYMRTHCSLYGDYKFIPSRQNVTIQQAMMDYHLDDVKSTDRFLDIGAHVGGVSVIVSDRVAKVCAIEPIYHKELMRNIAINEITNVDVICCGLGEGITPLEFNGNSSTVQCHSLRYIIDTFCDGHVDFLKIDCEGGEWNITPSELDGIRRIEGEIHSRDRATDGDNMFEFVNMLQACGYDVDIEKNNRQTMIIHATKQSGA